ncbi:MAG: hypothetical protein OXU73_01810 [Candidatus Campbellbacteria bacterium]|nr:hypothetical protein [Candidatus Campbellbacteria bacterium]
MKDFIRKLQKKDIKTRKRAAKRITFIIVGIIVVVWLAYLIFFGI